MKEYIGTKVINAKPMTKLEYNVLRGWKQPSDEDPGEKGYLVEYLDGGKPCHPDFENYISWSPLHVFEEAYKESGKLSFGDALVYLKQGLKLARTGWNGKGMYIVLMDGYPMTLANAMTREKHNLPEGSQVTVNPYIVMKTAQLGALQPGWLASQTDMLAEDWEIV